MGQTVEAGRLAGSRAAADAVHLLTGDVQLLSTGHPTQQVTLHLGRYTQRPTEAATTQQATVTEPTAKHLSQLIRRYGAEPTADLSK